MSSEGNGKPWKSFEQTVTRSDLCFRKMTTWKIHCSEGQEWRQGRRFGGLQRSEQKTTVGDSSNGNRAT